MKEIYVRAVVYWLGATLLLSFIAYQGAMMEGSGVYLTREQRHNPYLLFVEFLSYCAIVFGVITVVVVLILAKKRGKTITPSISKNKSGNNLRRNRNAIIEELKKLSDLKSAGVLSVSEFNRYAQPLKQELEQLHSPNSNEQSVKEPKREKPDRVGKDSAPKPEKISEGDGIAWIVIILIVFALLMSGLLYRYS